MLLRGHRYFKGRTFPENLHSKGGSFPYTCTCQIQECSFTENVRGSPIRKTDDSGAALCKWVWLSTRCALPRQPRGVLTEHLSSYSAREPQIHGSLPIPQGRIRFPKSPGSFPWSSDFHCCLSTTSSACLCGGGSFTLPVS